VKDRELRLGEGKISGLLSVALGALSLLAVLCFRYPELLTTPDLRAVYPVPLLRVALFASILVALASSLISFALSRSRLLPISGMVLAAAAIGLGGAWVETDAPGEQTRYLGVDWFVLDLLVLAVVFVPLERLFSLHREQAVLRPGFRTDLAHFFVSHLLVGLTLVLTMAPAAALFGWALVDWEHWTTLRIGVANQPVVLQILEAAFLADLFQYGIHRLAHSWPLLWRFHRIHHSSSQLDWLAGSRLHLVDVVITRSVSFIPLFIVGFSDTAMAAYVVLVSFQAVLIHANLRWRFGWLEWIIATPIYHHWHHTSESDALDRNFAVHLPLIDSIFGTAYLPGRWPRSYGIEGDPIPDNWFTQLAAPFHQAHQADSERKP
jgi:sterol desaturase/sphingolipid hydroxylase (fatty acid hydroxylase superfamily)